nr:hypothetical protein [Tanacetum cinerariifolium]
MNLFKISTSRRRSLGKEDASKQGRNLKQRSIFEESDFDVQAMMNAVYKLANQVNVKSRSDKGFHALHPPYTGNYIPTKLDLMFIDEQVKSEYVDVVSNVASSDAKTVVSKHSGEDRLKLTELMELSTKLSDRVLDLEKIKTTYAKDIIDLKKKVKKLTRKRRSRTSGMNLFNISTSRRRSLGEENASK